ncbi:cytochrome b/b6 domain-containing protein [Pigmentibacter sp. JX0631]|uniref:cytochrome b/b6 domain-containing protein n=1 Tax=Pigmentibacter sp. JX0631 TaxID=2976982 RepID=UPI0024691A47|nr:cytochrome b/b6 domain-containing protein [Pigmentibacter sp. JX0631]WGL61293.1 cytochrome b/b6 domain-containing protein [Pigmentibacter sp. JX0631]
MKEKNETSIEIEKYERKKIYDYFLIFLHWWNALSIFCLMLTIWIKPLLKSLNNWKEVLYSFHTYIGYALIFGLILRIIWGIIGPKHARFINMFQPSLYFKVIKLKKFKLLKSQDWGHDILGSLAYLKVYILLFIQALTGLYLAGKVLSIGPFMNFMVFTSEKTISDKIMKKTHEIIFYILMIFIIIHIFMLIYTEVKEKFPVAQSMLSGFQYRKKK